jgi:6,7-dimethyl-8-ribityllumazine synthase
MTTKTLSGNLIAEDIKLAIVVSRFNDFFTKQLLGGAIDCIERHGGKQEDITVVWVPGANEIPVTAKKLATSGKFEAIIALGAVIDGATPHAELINSQVAKSLCALSVSSDLPIINGVIAAHNLEQAIERSGTKAGNKGWSSALSAIEMVNLFKVV